MSRIHIFSMAFGRPFRESFCRYAAPSLMSAGNIPALIAAGHEVRWFVYAQDADVADIAEASGFLNAQMRIEVFGITATASLRAIQGELLVRGVEQALAENAIFVPAGAMTVWSNGSLANVVKVAETTDCAVAAMYLGVDADKWAARVAEYGSFPMGISGDALASEAFSMLHPGSRSTLNASDSQCHLTGTGMIQLAPDLIAARIQVPSVTAIRFKPQDLALFQLEGDFRAWDGIWPGTLIREGRYVFLASSDIAFQINLIRAGKQNAAAYAAMRERFGPHVDRRVMQRATLQGEAARTFMCSIRTSRSVVL